MQPSSLPCARKLQCTSWRMRGELSRNESNPTSVYLAGSRRDSFTGPIQVWLQGGGEFQLAELMYILGEIKI